MTHTAPASPLASEPLASEIASASHSSDDRSLLQTVLDLAKTDIRQAIARLAERAPLSPQHAAELFHFALVQHAQRGSRHAHLLAAHLIDSGMAHGAAPGQLDPCPLFSLSRVASESPRELPNPSLWGSWAIRVASDMRLAEADRNAVFDALLELPHPKPLREALALGLAIAPPEPQAAELFRQALAELRSCSAELLRATYSRPLLLPQALRISYRCDQWASIPMPPPLMPAEEARSSLIAASHLGCGRELITLLLNRCSAASALDDALLSQCCELSFNASHPFQPGRSLGALYASPAWTPYTRQEHALFLCDQACRARNPALFLVVSPHCDWSSLSGDIRTHLSAAFLAKCESEALRSKKISGSSLPAEQPRPKRSATRL